MDNEQKHEYIVVEDSSYNDALFKGLDILNLSEEEVNIEILEEKKGFLRKGYFKLKITPKVFMEKAEETQIEDENILQENEFQLEYRSDGVYLIILENSNVSMSNILDYLSKKSVKDYDNNQIIEIIKNKNGIAEKIAPYQEELIVDSTVHIEISNNKLEASILITEPIDGKTLTTKDIIQNLNENGIKFGIDKIKIEEVVKGNRFNEKISIAHGVEPIDGDDAEVIYTFGDKSDLSILNTNIDEAGRIDYKNLNKINNVKVDDLLVEIIPPTDGINGTDVYGNEVIAKKGTLIPVKKGKNVTESEDGLKFYATKDGESKFENNTIYVDEVINIDRNIDNETGNIQFNGKVNIKGNVRSGFKVEAEGDIEVFGVVEGATLISKGNITVHRGVQGNNQAQIYCLGNFKSKYIENANIQANNLEADVVLHSNIISKNTIVVTGKKGLIVGGTIKAAKEVRANILGSNMGTTTIVEVGIDPEEKDKYEQLKAEITTTDKNIDSSKKAVDLLTKMSQQHKLTKDKEALLAKSINTYEVLRKRYDSIAEELMILSEKLQNVSGGKIHASIIIYSGVRIIIGNNVRQIYDILNNCTLYVKDGEITIGPYEK